MLHAAFDQLDNFSLNERNYKGELLREVETIEKIDPYLMQLNDTFVTRCKRLFPARSPYALVHCITSGTHTEDSAHPVGKAIDEEVIGLSFIEAMIQALSVKLGEHQFTGIGIYPFVRRPFIHLDVKSWNRDLSTVTLWYRDVEGEYITSTERYEEVIDQLILWSDARMSKQGRKYGVSL
jgi:hypothetical protein